MQSWSGLQQEDQAPALIACAELVHCSQRRTGNAIQGIFECSEMGFVRSIPLNSPYQREFAYAKVIYSMEAA
jgi:hypothetical protein